MSEMAEKVAVRMFWKSEHLDPTEAGDCHESEWFGDAFPTSMLERDREFWRLLAYDIFQTIRVPSAPMVERVCNAEAADEFGGAPVARFAAVRIWELMIDEALR